MYLNTSGRFPLRRTTSAYPNLSAPRPIIGIDCRYIGKGPSGIGELVQALVDHVPALAPDLHFLFLKNPSTPWRLSEAENVDEVIVPHPANGPVTMWHLSHLVGLSSLAVFHATFNIMPAGLTMPCVTTIHDVMWLTDPDLCRPRFSRFVETWFYRQGIQRALQSAAVIATVSDATAAAIRSISPSSQSRLRLTLSGVSPDFRPVPASEALLRRLGLHPGHRYVLTVGQDAPYKNHLGALEAFAEAFPAREDIDLVLVQRLGKRGRGLLARAAALGMTNRVKILAGVTREELIGLYSSAEALLHPSYCEGFGNPLAEAMACGSPVVTSNCSAMPEVTAGAALLADPRDAVAMASNLSRVVAQPHLAAALSARGLARARELSWRQFAAANVSIYRELLGVSENIYYRDDWSISNNYVTDDTNVW